MSQALHLAGRGAWRHLMALALMLAATTVFAARPAGEIGKDWGDPAGN